MKKIAYLMVLLIIILVLGVDQALSQFVWTKDARNPVMSGGGAGSWNYHVLNPFVLFNNDSSRYEMWFAGVSATDLWKIGFATSPDGASWQVYPSPVLSPDPGAWDQFILVAPCVIRENHQYKMWYSAFTSSTGPSYIGYATSADGIHWDKSPLNPILAPGSAVWEGGGPLQCTVMSYSGGYKMWYAAWKGANDTIRIGYATSTDGMSWQRDTVHNPIFNVGAPGQWDGRVAGWPMVLQIRSTYYLWYQGQKLPEHAYKSAGVATSSDGVTNWTRYGGNPVFTTTPGNWDQDWAEFATVLLRGDTLHAWYDGSSGTQPLRIGHATSQFTAGIVRRVPAQYPTIQAAINAAANNDTVLVSDGKYYENIRFNGKRIIVGSTYLTTGDTSHISKTIIDGSHATNPDSSSVVYFIDGEDTNSVLCGFTITGGRGTILQRFPSLEGGGVLCYESGARLTRNIITGNTLSDNLDRYGVFGVGVSADGTGHEVLLMEGNTVTGNSATSVTHSASGGGIGMLLMKGILRQNVITDNSLVTQTTSFWAAGGGIYGEQGTLIADGNVIARNKALCPNITGGYMASGGGVFIEAMDLDFRNNRVISNVAQSSSSKPAVGGGLLMFANDLSEFRNCSVTGNYFASNQAWGSGATSGGGIDVYNENPRIENNIIVKNMASQGGGVGIHRDISATGSPTLINNTIAFNRATGGFGGGIYSRVSPSPVVINTIAWGDTGTHEIYVSGITGISVRNCDIQGGWPNDPTSINFDPMFVDTTYRLSESSECIGKGIDSTQINSLWYRAPESDFYGSSRPNPAWSKPDIGACENPRENPLGVDQESAGLPLVFALEQSYPNPFNPKTVISSQLPVASNVKLIVYDVLGREIAVLVNERRAAGSYQDGFDGTGLASGVYFYRLTAGSFIRSRTMLLLK
jgi:predicted GH43/DUF377 family glycosyl hydrolase